MLFTRAALTTAVIAAFGAAGAQAQNAPQPIHLPSVLAARFADMVGHWAVTARVKEQGESLAMKGRVDCSLVAAGTAVLCTGSFDSPPGAPITHAHFYGYDPVHKKLWVGVVNNYSGGGALTGTYSPAGLFIHGAFMIQNERGKTENDTQTITGKIGSGKLRYTIRDTVDGKLIGSFDATWVKQE